MWNPRPDRAVKMRALAARFRAQAAETSIAMFRRKFEAVAAELEEAAGRAEALFRLAS
jgi:hypothetical protein